LYVVVYRIQEVFEWIFEVDSGVSMGGGVGGYSGGGGGDDRGARLQFSLEYELTGHNKKLYGGGEGGGGGGSTSVENKAVARVQIQQDNTVSIVPVIKVRQFLGVVGWVGLTGEGGGWRTRHWPGCRYSRTILSLLYLLSR